MPKVEIRELGRGQGDKFDQTTEIEVDSKGIELFEADNPPTLRKIGQKTVEFSFNHKVKGKKKVNALVTKGGQLAESPVDIEHGESVNIRPWAKTGGPSEIPDARITRLRNGSE